MLGLISLFAILQFASPHELKILHPTNLRKKLTKEIHGEFESGLIKSSMGNFGHYNKRSTMRGRLHYPVSNTDGC